MTSPDRQQEPRAARKAPLSALRWLGLAALLGAMAGGVAYARSLLPEGEAVARGVRIGGALVSPGAGPRAAAEAAAAKLLARRVSFSWGDERVLEASLAELGATVDVDSIARAAASVAREGSYEDRIDEALMARRGEIDIPVRAFVPIEPFAERLGRFKEERDTPPVGAKLDIANKTVKPHVPGHYLDMYGAIAALERAIARGEDAITIPIFEMAPRASSEVVASIDTKTVISRFETRFGFTGGQQGRAQNIHRAAGEMDGVVLLPGDVVSFNQNVGARSIENGFAKAPEIYKGEMREGVGGGTCQVSGTLYAAAYLGGIDIVERSNHSRPSGYIRTGLDATVVYPSVDLKLKNPYDFPIVIHASIDKGALTFELLGRDKPATVSFETATVGVSPFKRKVEEAPALPEGKTILKQKGIRGLSLRKTRVLRLAGGKERTEVTTDVYPPTFEIWRVAPGTELDVLPPLPGEAPKDGEQKGEAQKADEQKADDQKKSHTVAAG